MQEALLEGSDGRCPSGSHADGMRLLRYTQHTRCVIIVLGCWRDIYAQQQLTPAMEHVFEQVCDLHPMTLPHNIVLAGRCLLHHAEMRMHDLAQQKLGPFMDSVPRKGRMGCSPADEPTSVLSQARRLLAITTALLLADRVWDDLEHRPCICSFACMSELPSCRG